MPLALTMGEPAGVGPDIAIKSWLAREDQRLPAFCFIGPESLVQQRAEDLGQKIETRRVQVSEAAAAFPDALPCLAGFDEVDAVSGHPKTATAQSVISSIETASALVEAGQASALVTNPIQKSVLAAAGFRHPGHTEFLGELSQSLFGSASVNPVMMLCAPALRVVPVTIHQSVRSVPDSLTADRIIEVGLTACRDLRDRFLIKSPRIAVSGLNPHAGEDGLMGTEEEDVISPAIAELQALGIDATGPHPADTLFHQEARASYDLALCMYHDQALIPIKTLDFDGAVNVTLGLPFIRTSPDHGTALPVAGTNAARATSLIAALKLAEDLAKNARVQSA